MMLNVLGSNWTYFPSMIKAVDDDKWRNGVEDTKHKNKDNPDDKHKNYGTL